MPPREVARRPKDDHPVGKVVDPQWSSGSRRQRPALTGQRSVGSDSPLDSQPSAASCASRLPPAEAFSASRADTSAAIAQLPVHHAVSLHPGSGGGLYAGSSFRWKRPGAGLDRRVSGVVTDSPDRSVACGWGWARSPYRDIGVADCDIPADRDRRVDARSRGSVIGGDGGRGGAPLRGSGRGDLVEWRVPPCRARRGRFSGCGVQGGAGRRVGGARRAART